jgi:hypothetical protein
MIRSYSERIGFTKHLELSSDMLHDIVYMNNKIFLTRLGIGLENWLQNTFGVVNRIKYLCFWKSVDCVKAEKFLYCCDHHLFAWIMCFSISGSDLPSAVR